MKIGLIDVDGHNFPNLALMRISAWLALRRFRPALPYSALHTRLRCAGTERGRFGGRHTENRAGICKRPARRAIRRRRKAGTFRID